MSVVVAPGAAAMVMVAPIPESATMCGLPGALSTIVNVPVRLPLAAGEKVTLIMHDAPMPTATVQPFTTAKSPLAVALVMVSGAPPLFVTVTVWAALVEPTSTAPKKSGAERLNPGTLLEPVPERATLCGLPAALSTMKMVPLRLPGAEGVKVTKMVQELPGATLGRQLSVSAKSPTGEMALMVSVEPPVLVSVTGIAAVVTPMA